MKMQAVLSSVAVLVACPALVAWVVARWQQAKDTRQELECRHRRAEFVSKAEGLHEEAEQSDDPAERNSLMRRAAFEYLQAVYCRRLSGLEDARGRPPWVSSPNDMRLLLQTVEVSLEAGSTHVADKVVRTALLIARRPHVKDWGCPVCEFWFAASPEEHRQILGDCEAAQAKVQVLTGEWREALRTLWRRRGLPVRTQHSLLNALLDRFSRSYDDGSDTPRGGAA